MKQGCDRAQARDREKVRKIERGEDERREAASFESKLQTKRAKIVNLNM